MTVTMPPMYPSVRDNAPSVLVYSYMPLVLFTRNTPGSYGINFPGYVEYVESLTNLPECNCNFSEKK